MSAAPTRGSTRIVVGDYTTAHVYDRGEPDAIYLHEREENHFDGTRLEIAAAASRFLETAELSRVRARGTRAHVVDGYAVMMNTATDKLHRCLAITVR